MTTMAKHTYVAYGLFLLLVAAATIDECSCAPVAGRRDFDGASNDALGVVDSGTTYLPPAAPSSYDPNASVTAPQQQQVTTDQSQVYSLAQPVGFDGISAQQQTDFNTTVTPEQINADANNTWPPTVDDPSMPAPTLGILAVKFTVTSSRAFTLIYDDGSNNTPCSTMYNQIPSSPPLPSVAVDAGIQQAVVSQGYCASYGKLVSFRIVFAGTNNEMAGVVVNPVIGAPYFKVQWTCAGQGQVGVEEADLSGDHTFQDSTYDCGDGLKALYSRLGDYNGNKQMDLLIFS